MDTAGKNHLVRALLSGHTRIAIPVYVIDWEGSMLYIQILPSDELEGFELPYVNEGLEENEDLKDPRNPVSQEVHEKLSEGMGVDKWKAM